MRFPFSDYFVLFGAVSLVLGILGYIRAKSMASLVAGGISGVGLVASGIIALLKTGSSSVNPGYIMGLALSVLLLGRFLPGFLKSKTFYPAGLMALLSLLGIAAGISGLVFY
ncbi:MAG: TMEM14 family protein [Verrucomicrobiota bacterium]